AQIAILLQKAFGVHVRGVDLGTLHSPSTFYPWLPGDVFSKVYQHVDVYKVNKLWHGDEQGTTTVCLRAWISARIGVSCTGDIRNVKKIDTTFLNSDEHQCISTLCLESYLLEMAKPQESPNEFNSFKVEKGGNMLLENSRFSTRVRRSDQTEVIMTDEAGTEYIGRACHTKGKTTTIHPITKATLVGAPESVRVIGRQEPTNSERAQSELLLLLLRGEKDLRTSFFTRTLWFPKWKGIKYNRDADCGYAGKVLLSHIHLNPSQWRAAVAMISGTPLVVTHGPPGTGKTTTIAAAAKVWDICGQPAWITAHSNVAVKNIAESLFNKGVKFVLLVSNEFYEEWHEHLYTDIESYLIRSDELPKDKVEAERLLNGSTIVLSTLSMLSNPAFEINGIFDLVPVERLVIDEASQIRVFEYLHIFIKFQKKLLKVCYFGDPKQLPPFGIEKAPNIQTIFELEHIISKDTSFFLDTQYRIPICLGTFISHTIYESKLKSVQEIKTPDCLKFVDVGVQRGEEIKDGSSWKNLGEVQIVVELIRTYYRHKNFCILSPYDAQRAAIEKQLKAENLPWDNVYNVDSFQ
ncbi:P-loop containing nucleoside triphosphate hydrolase protein, partial [Cyathus striatus]